MKHSNSTERNRHACMRLSCLAQDRVDLAEAPRHLAQKMSEPREFDFVPPKRAARRLVGKLKAAIRFRRQEHVDKITVFVDSDVAGDPVSRISTTGLVAQIGNHTVKSGSTLQSLTALSVGEAEFCAVVKGRQVGPSLRSIYMFRGIPMKVEIQNESSTVNSLTDRLRAGPRTQHIDTRFFLGTRRSARRRSQYQEIPTAKFVQMLERSQSLLQYFCSIANLLDWFFLLTMDPTSTG